MALFYSQNLKLFLGFWDQDEVFKQEMRCLFDTLQMIRRSRAFFAKTEMIKT